MKREVVPAINAKTFEEILHKIKILKDYTNHFHLDVATKESTNYETWHKASELKLLPKELKIDLHLMTSLKPLDINQWSDEVVISFILHPEYSINFDGLLKQTKKLKKKIYIAWSPGVEEEIIKKYLSYVDGILVLGVKPGKSGQEMVEDTIERLIWCQKNKKEKQKIMIDGGVKRDNFLKIKNFADIIVIGSGIYNEENPLEAYFWFKNNAD
jgi:ribulose-phosphate 3-epimerase